MNIEETINRLRLLLMILVIFIFGFFVGYWAKNVEYEEKIYMQTVEIDSLRENIDRLKQIKKLEWGGLDEWRG